MLRVQESSRCSAVAIRSQITRCLIEPRPVLAREPIVNDYYKRALKILLDVTCWDDYGFMDLIIEGVFFYSKVYFENWFLMHL